MQVSGIQNDITAIAAGSYHTCALTDVGGVLCWGRNWFGQLSDGTGGEGDMSTTPVQVSGLERGVTAIATRKSYTCALTDAGGVLCWGNNASEQLGDGTGGESGDISTIPAPVDGLESRVTAIAAGGAHTCVMTDAGGVLCWGRNRFGELGDGTGGEYGDIITIPVQVSSLESGATAIAAGWGYTCALTATGSLYCWGENWSGQLGDGTTNSSPVPVEVALTEPIRQPDPGTSPPPSPITRGISGKVTYADGSNAPRVRVTLYRQEGGIWQPVIAATTNSDGEYAFTGVVSGTYRAWFFDTTRTNRSVYYIDATTIADADDIAVVDDQVTDGINATLEPPAPPVAQSEMASGSVTVDIDDGTLDIAFSRGNTSALTITTEVTCTGGVDPADVTLWLGTTAYSMTEEPAGSGQYEATIPATDIDQGMLKVTWQCDGDEQEKEIGDVVFYDPSGIISDSATGEPVPGARVLLYHVPGVLPDTATETHDCRTVDTREDGTWDNLPPTDGDEGVVVNPDVDLSTTLGISPTINPQTTNVEGRYGWDVSEGCWYIEVSAKGYESTFSPIVGVPPEVMDLDLALEPVNGSSGPVSEGVVYLPLVQSATE